MARLIEQHEVGNQDLGTARIVSGINIALGAWLLIAPFVWGYSGTSTALWNDWIVGAIVIILGAIRVWRPTENTWLSWVNAVLGVWLVIAPFVLNYCTITAALWNDIIVGVAIAVLGAWSAMSSPNTAMT
ncbi:MAG: SPW repeat protein [Anaerolineales bacterium]|nr:SPW repeat protein [Anaerolineales bacterium]